MKGGTFALLMLAAIFIAGNLAAMDQPQMNVTEKSLLVDFIEWVIEWATRKT